MRKEMKKTVTLLSYLWVSFVIFSSLIRKSSSQSLPLVYYRPQEQNQWQQRPEEIKYYYNDPSRYNPNQVYRYNPNQYNPSGSWQVTNTRVQPPDNQGREGRRPDSHFFPNQIPIGPPDLGNSFGMTGFKDFPGHNFWPGTGVIPDPKIPGHHFIPDKEFDKNFPGSNNFPGNPRDFPGIFPGNSRNFPGHSIFHEDNACVHPLEVGTCGGYQRRFYFNFATKKCEEFIYKGCRSNSNNFENPEVCKSTCGAEDVVTLPRDEKDANVTCNQELSSGLCFSSYKRFYYNQKSKHCHEFMYSGCEGNLNNFYNPNDCMNLCKASGIKLLFPSSKDGHTPGTDGHGDEHDVHGDHLDPNESDKVCNLNLDKGSTNCAGHRQRELPRFFHNSTSKLCEEFIYTGCEGNLNNFKHGDTCVNFCKAKGVVYIRGEKPIPIHPDCLQGVTRGYCGGNYVAFFFNPSTRVCQAYLYSGCGSGPNHFASAHDCINRCPALHVNQIPIYV